MPIPVAEVAAALRARLPDLPTKKLHKLLYYCQGHHLAAFGTPLFAETISAWDMGPVVGELWYAEDRGKSPPAAGRRLDEAELNTVGYVVSRYGGLTGRDLERLTHGERPWQRADGGRPPGGSVRIDLYCSRATRRWSGVNSAQGRICSWTRCCSSGDMRG